MKKTVKTIYMFLMLAFLLTATPAFAEDWSYASSRFIDFEANEYDSNNNFNAMYAAELINGTVLSPGEIFSFNEVLGPRTTERGFVVGHNAAGAPDVGSGICRGATVLFQTARDAGMSILERHTHTPYVDYALPGNDAAVQYGMYDMRFMNIYNVPVMIRTRGEHDTDGMHLWAVFYKMESPKKVNITVSGEVYKQFDGSLINGITFIPLSKANELYGKKYTLVEKNGLLNIDIGGVFFSEVNGEVIRNTEGFCVSMRKCVNSFGGAIHWTPGDVPKVALNKTVTDLAQNKVNGGL